MPKYLVKVKDRFSEMPEIGGVIELDENAAAIPLEEGAIEIIEPKKEEAEEKQVLQFDATSEKIVHEGKSIDIDSDEGQEIIKEANTVIDSHLQKHGKKVLMAAKEILDKLKVEFFLSNGTLLGAAREKNFIAHDTDIDLGVFVENWNPELGEEIKNSFYKKGFELYSEYGSQEKGLQYSFKKNDIKLDVFFYYKGPKYWMAVWQGEKMYRYLYTKFELKNMNFLKKRFKVPKNVEKYLKEQYGPDWMTPDSDWSCYSSPKNIKDE